MPLQKEVKHELLRPLNHNLDCSPCTVKNQWAQKQSIMGTKCSCILKNRVKQMIKVKYQKNVGIQADILPSLFSMRIMPEYFQFRLTQKFQGHKFQKTMFRMTFGCWTCERRWTPWKETKAVTLGWKRQKDFLKWRFSPYTRNFLFLICNCFWKMKIFKRKKSREKII